jgi:cytochrome P450
MMLSMLATGRPRGTWPLREFMGTLALLIVGGNDTTRNTMTGGLLALHRHPDQWPRCARTRHSCPGLVQETIRWQTPVIHMRRTARENAELGGQHIRAGDKVVMWYVSGNPDEEVIDDPEGFVTSTGPDPGAICPSVPASIAAWAIGWPSCNYKFCGRRS